MLNSISLLSSRMQLRRGLLFGLLIVTALLAFELFNYSTTDFALSDLLGDLTFMGIRWATILSIAFCGIDFAGIARLFTPEQGANEPHEVWYLFGAWMLAATMNASLTWWGVSIAILNHQTLCNAVVARDTLIKIVPVFVAVMVWLIRVLIIGTISVAGDRLFSQAEFRKTAHTNTRTAPSARTPTTTRSNQQLGIRPLGRRTSTVRQGARASGRSSYASYNPAPKPEPEYEPDYAVKEPTYSPVSFNVQNNNRQRQTRF
jgi:hypothetical protein